MQIRFCQQRIRIQWLQPWRLEDNCENTTLRQSHREHKAQGSAFALVQQWQDQRNRGYEQPKQRQLSQSRLAWTQPSPRPPSAPSSGPSCRNGSLAGEVVLMPVVIHRGWGSPKLGHRPTEHNSSAQIALPAPCRLPEELRGRILWCCKVELPIDLITYDYTWYFGKFVHILLD